MDPWSELMGSVAWAICSTHHTTFIITPWGKYQYLRLPMGVNMSPDIFQEKMSDLMAGLEFARTYLDGLLIISNSTFKGHLCQLQVV